MTEDEIRNMPAGREIDMLMAAQMGWSKCQTYVIDGRCHEMGFPPNCAYVQTVPSYSTDIAQAWRVVEAMANLKPYGTWCQIRTPFSDSQAKTGYPSEDDCWAGFTPHGTSGWNGKPDCWAGASTVPLAICRAALLKVIGFEP